MPSLPRAATATESYPQRAGTTGTYGGDCGLPSWPIRRLFSHRTHVGARPRATRYASARLVARVVAVNDPTAPSGASAANAAGVDDATVIVDSHAHSPTPAASVRSPCERSRLSRRARSKGNSLGLFIIGDDADLRLGGTEWAVGDDEQCRLAQPKLIRSDPELSLSTALKVRPAVRRRSRDKPGHGDMTFQVGR